MKADIRFGSHKAVALTKVASAKGYYPHTYDITLSADHDNGDLVMKGDYDTTNYDTYKEGTGAIKFTGKVRQAHPDYKDMWEIEVEDTNALLVSDSAISPYSERELQDETLLYNEKGSTVKANGLVTGDIFSVTANGFTGTPADGAAITGYADGKYTIA